MRREISLRRLLWDRLNLHQERQCLIRDYSTRQVDLILVSERKMTITFMISHFSQIELQLLSTRMLKVKFIMMTMMMAKTIYKLEGLGVKEEKHLVVISLIEDSRALIIPREPDLNQSNLKRNFSMKIMPSQKLASILGHNQIKGRNNEKII